MNKYQLNAINILRVEIRTARKAREENDFSRFRTICNMIRSELGYCSTIGLFSLEKEKLLLRIADSMVHHS